MIVFTCTKLLLGWISVGFVILKYSLHKYATIALKVRGIIIVRSDVFSAV